MLHNDLIRKQFDLRSNTFESSVHWVTDKNLVDAHVRLAGKPPGKALDLCCGTGAVARGLKSAGWDAEGVDISEGMVLQAKQWIPARVADVADLPYPDEIFDAVTMRQAYFLLDNGPKTLSEVRRVMKPNGVFILSHLVHFSEVDAGYLEVIHRRKQAQLRAFHTVGTLQHELETNGFQVTATEFVVVRESVSLWMREAPELSEARRQEICDLVVQAPEEYRRLRRVEVRDGEILEDWNFVLFQARKA